MKNSLFIVLLCLTGFGFVANAQNPYGNEWIDRNNTSPYFKIKVHETGLYMINYTIFDSIVTKAGFPITVINPKDIQIFHKGKEVAIYVFGEADGIFHSQDFIEFFGEKNDGSFDTYLYGDQAAMANPYYSLFTDTAAYYLTWNNNPAVVKARMKSVNNNLTNPPAKENYFNHKMVQSYSGTFQSGMKTYAQQYLTSSKFEIGEGFTDSDFNKGSKTKSFTVEDIYTAGPVSAATVKSRIVSVFDQEHRIRFSINNNLQMDTVFGSQTKYTGQQVNTFKNTVPLSVFNNNSNIDNFVFEALGTGSSDRNALGYIEVYYPRTFNFNNKNNFEFNLKGTASSTKYIEITNFNHNNNTPVLYDLTNKNRIEGVINGNVIRFNIPMQTNDSIRLFLSNQSAVKSISSINQVPLTNFHQPFNQGNYIIISHNALMDDGNGINWVENYRQYRASVNGGGQTAIVVDVEDLYDQFSYGIEKHPLAIQNFIRFALDSFQVKPENVFLIGKSYEYNTTRTSTSNFRNNLVPSFGYPASDNLLAATVSGEVAPKVGIGRLSARNPFDIEKYYNKVVVLEQNQKDFSNQSISEKAWMKRVLHFGGGSSAYEQGWFKYFLSTYEKMIEDTLFGGTVTSFYKTSPDPIQYVQSKFLDSLISGGVSLITFFGHSSAGSFDVNLDQPKNYNNYGKYPVMLSNGCFAGNIHAGAFSASENFVLEKDKAAIAFIAVTNYGETSALNKFSTHFYKNLSYENYNDNLGTLLKNTFYKYEQALPGNDNDTFSVFVLEQKTLHGDPFIKINAAPKPDYAIETPYIQFNPKNVSVSQDSFDVQVIIHNLGKAIDTTIEVQLTRKFFDNTLEVQVKSIKAPKYLDTLTFTFYTDPVKGYNLNEFTANVDWGNIVDEITNVNNIAVNTIFIESNTALPVYPYEYSIVGNNNFTLKASTANATAAEKQYRVQIDTTMDFNSAILASTDITSKGGVIEWANPMIQQMDSTVYYWRISPVENNIADKWQHSSFVYINNHPDGWNQSHYFQYLNNTFSNIELLQNRRLKFVDDVKEVRVVTGKYPNAINWDQSAYFLNNEQRNWWSTLGPGAAAVIVAVFDSITGLPWNGDIYNFGHVKQDGESRRWAFHFRTNSTANRALIINALRDSIPDGHHLLIYSFENPQYKSWKGDSATLGTHLFKELENLGAYGIDTVAALMDSVGIVPFAFFVKKGDPSTAQLVMGLKGVTDKVDTSFNFTGNWDRGNLSSTIIGPAKEWNNLNWRHVSVDAVQTDEASVDVIGIDTNGVRTTIFDMEQPASIDLSAIDANQYPYLQLTMNNKDDSLRTPAQLRHWRVSYQPAPEAAINPLKYYSVSKDSLEQGEILKVGVGVENISKYDMDSLLVKYSLIDANNVLQTISYIRKAPLLTGDTMKLDFELNSLNYPGNNNLIVEINPDNDQPEQHHFNNVLFVPFYVKKDNYNPFLDVTFDGRHIMNGDIVSSRPNILIKLKDENKYLPLNDTALVDVYLKMPTGTKHKLNFDGVTAKFNAADPSNLNKDNSATIEMTPELPDDGTYELIVAGRDRSGNESGELDYNVAFEVVNKPMISNMLNYPNPFTSNTKFVFTLTGYEVPSYIKIQILTVTGKVVKEITKEELGPIYIGTNVSQYAWDGTDQFGDPLANGVYLYRVISNLNGKEMDHFENKSVDKYFKSGFGKMYLAR